MPIPTYTPGYPPDGASLGQTKSTIRNNLDGTFQTLAVDHVNNNGQPGSQPAGYHTVIHEVPQTNVSTVSGYNQIFSGVPGTLIVNGITTPAIPPNNDQQLYSLTGQGGLSQLTGSNPVSNGYAWMGGMLFQWGRLMGFAGNWPTTPQPLSFNANFPHNCFSVYTTFIGPTSSTTGDITINSTTLTSFTWQFSGSSSAGYGGFYWLAIGN